MDMLTQAVQPIVSDDQMVVKRLDIARDFVEIECPSKYVRAFGEVHHPRATRNRLYFGPRGCQTAQAGTTSGGTVIVYDKHVQTKGLAPPGTLRAEAQCRTRWLQRYGGIRTVDDITPRALRTLAHNRFRWFGLERSVMTRQSAVEVVLRSDIDIRTRLGMSLYIFDVYSGRTPVISKPTEIKYRNLLADLAIAPVGEREMDWDTSITRLNLKTGTEIVVA